MSNKWGYIVPFALALGLLIGLVTGVFVGNGASQMSTKFSGGNGKVEELIDFIDSKYVDTVNKKALMETAITEMLQSLDPHSDYIPAEYFQQAHEQLDGRFVGIGVRFLIHRDTLNVTHIIAGGPSERVGLKPGDKIVAVDGNNVAGVGLKNEDVFTNLKGPEGSDVVLSILRDGKKVEQKITRGPVEVSSLSAAYMLNKKVGYIKLDRFAGISAREFREAMDRLNEMGMEHLVFDLRNNGGGYMNAALGILDELFGERVLLVYTEGEHEDRQDYFSRGKGALADDKVVVLINENSASASEIVAGALQDNDRGIIVGRRSFGKGLVQNEFPLSDGSAFRLTVSRYYTPSGRSIQKPYGNGVDYEMEVYNRYAHGEMYSADSMVVADSLKFKTKEGRTVYGGGGIYPDYFVPQDTSERTSKYVRDLFYKSLFLHYAYEYATTHRELAKNKTYFIKSFEITDAMLTEVAVMGEELFGVEAKPEELIKYKAQLARLLKANIADQLWTASEYYEVRNYDDIDIKQAVEVIELK